MGGQLICYQTLRKKQKEGDYIVPLGNAEESSGKPFSSNKQTLFSIGASASSGKYVHESYFAKTYMFSFTKMSDLSFTIRIFKGALWELVDLTAGELYTNLFLLDFVYLAISLTAS